MPGPLETYPSLPGLRPGLQTPQPLRLGLDIPRPLLSGLQGYATNLPTYWMLVTFTALYLMSLTNLGLS